MTVTHYDERDGVDLDRVADWFRLFVESETADLPLYRALAEAMADDRELLSVMSAARPGQWRPVLFFAALHLLVLENPDDDLAAFYPTVTGEIGPIHGDPVAALRRFMADHRSELASIIARRSTQTNEVNRTCLWFAALRHAASDPVAMGRPLALVEVGASAGFNLHIEEYGYDFADGTIYGNPGSDIQLHCLPVGDRVAELHRLLQRPLPPIIERIGVDLHPIHAADAAETRWLKACIWAEQLERHDRFDAALNHSLEHPVHMIRDDALDGTADAIELCPPDAHVVVMNSWTLTYLERARRDAFASLLDVIGATRTLTWISAEAAGINPTSSLPLGPTGADTIVNMTRWRDGTRYRGVVARCHPHLRWIDWLA